MSRVVRIICFLFLLLPLILSATLYLLLANPHFQKEATAQVSYLLSRHVGLPIEVGQLSYQFPLQVHLQEISCTINSDTKLQLAKLSLSLFLYELVTLHAAAGELAAEIEGVPVAGTYIYAPDSGLQLKLKECAAPLTLYGEFNLSPARQIQHTLLHFKAASWHTPDFSLQEMKSDLHIEGALTHPTISATCWSKKLRVQQMELDDLFAHLTLNALGVIKLSFAFKAGSGRCDGQCQIEHSNLNGSFLCKKIVLSQMLPSTYPISVELSGEGILSGSLQDPRVALKFNLEGEIPGSWPFRSSFSCHIGKNRVVSTGVMQVKGVPPLHGSASVPLAFSLVPLQLQLMPQEPFDAHLASCGALEGLFGAFLPSTLHLNGSFTANFELSGSLEEPKYLGVCDIQEGSIEDTLSGMRFSDLNARLSLSERKLLLERLHATDEKGGSLTGSGNLQIAPEQQFPFSAELHLSDIHPLNLDLLDAQCSGPLQLQGDREKATLAGTLNIEHALLKIPDKKNSAIDSIDVTYVNLNEAEPPPQILDFATPEWPLNLDLTLKIPKTLTIEGRTLTSVWKGELYVQHSAKHPQLFGQLKVDHGQALVNGKPFEIKQGTITIEGDPEKKSSLYVIASKNFDELKVDLIVKGSAQNPSISFRSNPPLPQREILSWVLFNRGASEISPFEGRQLNETITNLDTQSNRGLDFLAKIQKALGIDRIEFTRNENSESNPIGVQVGKYLSDKVYISIKKSDINRLALEAALMHHVKVQAEVGDDSEGRVMLKWKRDY